jgi:hypothetical protein
MMNKVLLLFVALTSLMIPSLVNAQSTDPVSSQNDPAAVAAAQQLIKTTKIDVLGPQLFSAMLQQFKKIMSEANPGREKEVESIINIMNQEFSRNMPDFTNQISLIYAKHFTAVELEKLNQFYQTPLGAKTLTLMPTLMQEGMALGQIWINQLAPKIAQLMVQEMRKRNMSLPKGKGNNL